MSKEKKVPQESTEIQAVEDQKVPPTLTLDTLAWAARVIDVAAKRGAFHANEMTNVGRTYDSLVGYVEHYRPTEPKKEESDSESK